jgi:threonine dehydrogenase-like Zn-dependent dehydrogenase
MKTVICEKPGQMAVAEREMPSANPNDVLIRTKRVGVCGTDLHVFTGNQPCPSITSTS